MFSASADSPRVKGLFFWTDQHMKTRDQFTLTIQDAWPNNPVPITPRLRRMLKSMLRGYGIRCVAILPVTSPSSPPPEPDVAVLTDDA